MPSSNVPSFVNEPQIQYLEQLLEEVQRGLLRVPRFQRPFVWSPEQRLELLRSIRDGIPIGTIMVWRTQRRIATYSKLGRHSIAKRKDPEAVKQYILDGVQRLTTLFGALFRSTKSAQAGDTNINALDVYYDLDAKEFVLADEAQGTEHLPLSIVLDSVELLKFQRQLPPKRSKTWIERSDQIARAFREYKIPIIPIATEDLGLATRTLQRINSQGTVMSELHMLNALAWSKDFDLLQQIDTLRSERLAKAGWADLDDDLIVKACKAALGFDVYETNRVDQLSNEIATVLPEVFRSIERAASFLNDECNIRRPWMVPYGLQVVVLAEAMRVERRLSRTSRERLRTWLWLTTYNELFASMSAGRLQIVIDLIREDARGSEISWPGRNAFKRRPLPPRFDFRAARAKALALRLAEAAPRAVDGSALKAFDLLHEEGVNALAQLVPRESVSGAAYGSPGNRVIYSPGDIGELREALATDPTPELLASHAISSEAFAAYSRGDYSDFIAQRLRDLDRREEKFVKGLAISIE
jgi:hypothetical protein